LSEGEQGANYHVASKDDMNSQNPVSETEQAAELDSELESLCLSVTRHALD
jgi:hypothetical protein